MLRVYEILRHVTYSLHSTKTIKFENPQVRILENQRTMAEDKIAVARPRKRGAPPRTLKDDQQDPQEVGKLIRTYQVCIGSFYTATPQADSSGPADVSPAQGDHDH